MFGSLFKPPLTGGKVALIFIGCFVVIIAANMALLYNAINSFPGLTVKNSYQAGVGFDARRMAQVELGWQAAPAYDNGLFTLSLLDKSGAAAPVIDLEVTIGRAARDSEDRLLALEGAGGIYHSAVDLAPGEWAVRIAGRSPEGVAFLQQLKIYVPE